MFKPMCTRACSKASRSMSKPLCTRACSKASRSMSKSLCTRACSLKAKQADVYTCSCGTNSLNVPALQQLPACFWDEYQALQQLLKEEENNKEGKEGGKGVKEEDKEEISWTCIDKSSSSHVNYMLWSNNNRFHCIL